MNKVDLRSLLEQLASEECRAGKAGGAIVEGSRLLPCERDERLQRLDGHRRRCNSHDRHRCDLGDADEIPDRIERKVLVDDIGYDMPVGGQHQRVAVGPALRHARSPRKARPVLDNHRLLPSDLQLIGDDTGKGIADGTGRKRNHYSHGLVWKVLRRVGLSACLETGDHQCRKARSNTTPPRHDHSSPTAQASAGPHQATSGRTQSFALSPSSKKVIYVEPLVYHGPTKCRIPCLAAGRSSSERPPAGGKGASAVPDVHSSALETVVLLSNDKASAHSSRRLTVRPCWPARRPVRGHLSGTRPT